MNVDRPAGIQTGRLVKRHSGRQIDRQTGRQAGRQTGRQADTRWHLKIKESQADTGCTDVHRQTQTGTGRQTQADTDVHRKAGKQAGREADKQTGRHRQAERQTQEDTVRHSTTGSVMSCGR
jgi:hypothetical protein